MKKKKNSAMKKLIPATSMLLVSATMLTASTYAWFTMSREVEVTGIKLTATTPEDIQISLGDNTGIVKSGTTDKKSLNVGTPTDKEYGLIKYTQVVAPDGASGSSATAEETRNTTDWYNTVDFSQHYVVGKIKPSSSTDGNYLFKTSDSIIVGKDVSKTAQFTKVSQTDEAGLYCIGSLDNDKEVFTTTTDERTYVTSSDDNKSGENLLKQGYYVDFPVWFRTSTKESVVSGNGTTAYISDGASSTRLLNLGVVATITQRTAVDSASDLHHAVRVSVLEATGTDTMVSTGSEGVVFNNSDLSRTYYDRYSKTGSGSAKNGAIDVISTDMNTKPTTMTNQAVYQEGNLIWSPTDNAVTNATSIYGSTDFINQANSDGTTGESVVSIPLPGDGEEYGYSGRYVIRIWLEGEDIDCWNETAGQDWNISLKFVRLTVNGSDATAHDGVTSYATPSTDTTTPTASTVTASCGTTAAVLSPATTVTITYSEAPTGSVATAEWTWDATDGVYKLSTDSTKNASLDGANKKTYKLADGTTFANDTDLANYLKENRSKYKLDTLTLTKVS